MKELLSFVMQPVSILIIVLLGFIIGFAIYNVYGRRISNISAKSKRDLRPSDGYERATPRKTSPFAP